VKLGPVRSSKKGAQEWEPREDASKNKCHGKDAWDSQQRERKTRQLKRRGVNCWMRKTKSVPEGNAVGHKGRVGKFGGPERKRGGTEAWDPKNR